MLRWKSLEYICPNYSYSHCQRDTCTDTSALAVEREAAILSTSVHLETGLPEPGGLTNGVEFLYNVLFSGVAFIRKAKNPGHCLVTES